MERGLGPACTKRQALCRSKVIPRHFDPEPSLVSPGEGPAGPREGGPAAGSHGEGTGRRGKHLGVSSASDEQTDMRQGAPARVNQSKSQQIAANVDVDPRPRSL